METSWEQPEWLDDLIHAQNLGKERAFQLMMDAWHQPIYQFLRTMLGTHEDAADATQETFIQVLRSVHRFRKEAKFSTWLYTIARRKGLDALRSMKQRALRVTHHNAELWSNQFRADPYFNGDDAERQLHAALQNLPERQREVFALRYFQELPYDDIARLMDTSVGAAKANFFHAKNKVRSALTSFDGLNLSLTETSQS
jgi:RNA polymerase sigma-70 factor (ECF subfamily)